MNLNNISAWSIRNPIVPIVAFIGLMLAGLLSFSQMEVQNNPDIELPMAIVIISQPGAAPSEIENQITQRVEAAVNTINGVQSISSTAEEGASQTQVEFAIGTDINQAVNEVKNQIDQIRADLPDGILEPRVFKVETSSDTLANFGIAADDMTLEQLSWFVDDTVAKRLLTVPGLAEVSRNGGVSREILVSLHPDKMQSLGVTASQVNQTLRTLNVNAAGGRAEIAGSRQSVRVLGNAESAYDLSQTQISLGAGRIVKLADIADVRDSYGEITSLSKIDGRPVVTFGITRARGASDVSVYDSAETVLTALEKENPGIKFTRLFTEVDYTKDQYSSSMMAMVEGAILAVIVVFLFLRDGRATIIAALAIPLSAIPTFWFMDMLGFTLNQMSLLALGLVAGVLVDDAIVEIENIVRHMRMGKSAYQASIDAADEIGLAVVATTFSIVAVFFPVALMPGVAGEFFKNFGLTVVVSVLMSLAVARMITPMIAAYFLKAHGHAEHGEGVLMDRYMGVLHWSLDRSKAERIKAQAEPVPTRWYEFFVGLIVAVALLGVFCGVSFKAGEYFFGLFDFDLGSLVALFAAVLVAMLATWLAGKIIGVILTMMGGHLGRWSAYMALRTRARFADHRVWMMGIGFFALLATVGFSMSVPTQFFPNTDSNFSRVSLNMVPGTTVQQMEETTSAVAARLSKEPEVELALERIFEGEAFILLTLREDRARTSLDFERDLTPVLQAVPDARINFQSQNGGGGSGRAISVMLSSSSTESLDAAAAQLVEQMKGVPGVVGPRIEADLRRPEIIVKPRLDLASSLGVTTSALSQTIRIATLGDIDQNAARFSLSDRQIPIRVRLAESDRRSIATIQNLPVATENGGSVPLSRVADISFGSGPTTIQRYNQQRRIFVSSDLAPGAAKGDVMTRINNLPIMKDLPNGVSNAPFGEDQWQAELMTNFVVALVTGVLLVFAVLVLLYRRLVSPLVNMGSLLLAPLGGILAIYMMGMDLTLPVFIGVLMLFGIVAKNSILLIDFAIEEMNAGRDKFEAIIDAGHKRAQPIAMTTVAMTAGMLPTALSLTGDSAWRQPMGVVVIGGLVLSTLLTLLIVPAGFSLADGFEKRLGPWLGKRLLTYKKGDDQPVTEPHPAH
ncbi:AcrB/AcrD/AcrF family protein [Altererythrobacter xixiisoli]|uniref:AcrB/AcrD/AcrF family protein n=1 Tax=Croceibacterium xixiisoli TaxID=1476466 RepID=A0A6I4TNG8_9SPHN|nr:efflux RND transporter permease subunit [Croceibacterium xixiisoli]MXO97376.1 AcrB/AcrD/AcrF family protein [Croceibacterium xixiisoli]